MKYLIVLFHVLIVIIIPLKTFPQTYFTELPKDFQLFPREDNNSAFVNIEGNITNFSFKKISLYVKKDSNLYNYQTLNLPLHRTYNFHFQTQIFALPVEYDFKVYLHFFNGDSLEVIHRQRIVCGDIYVLYGQSNIAAMVEIDQLNTETDDRLLRNFDFDGGHLNVDALKWFPAKEPYGRVGAVGLPLQKSILQQFNVPTCIINGAIGGASINELNQRTPDNPEDVSNYYGRLFTRIKHANAIGKVKAIIWRQGEEEACFGDSTINEYPTNFTFLYENLKEDLGNFEKFYNIQIAIHYYNPLVDAGELREYMRKTKYLFDKIETSTALGIPLVDRFHHSKQGYQQMSDEVFQMIKKDIYHSNETIEIRPPDIQKIIKSSSGDTLTLVFEEGQIMKYPNDTTINDVLWQMKNYFYINSATSSDSNLINNGWAIDNRIVLVLNNSIADGSLTYLPSYSTNAPPTQEVHLKNSKGLRAMSFHQFPIANTLTTPTIDSIKYESVRHLKLFFNDADNKVVERRTNLETTFNIVGKVAANFLIDTVNSDSNLTTIYYRIKEESAISESKYSLIKSFLLDTCNENLILMGNVISPIARKGNQIESTEKVSANSSYFFQKSVELKAGFETQGNVTFRIDNSGCQ